MEVVDGAVSDGGSARRCDAAVIRGRGGTRDHQKCRLGRSDLSRSRQARSENPSHASSGRGARLGWITLTPAPPTRAQRRIHGGLDGAPRSSQRRRQNHAVDEASAANRAPEVALGPYRSARSEVQHRLPVRPGIAILAVQAWQHFRYGQAAGVIDSAAPSSRIYATDARSHLENPTARDTCQII